VLSALRAALSSKTSAALEDAALPQQMAIQPLAMPALSGIQHGHGHADGIIEMDSLLASA